MLDWEIVSSSPRSSFSNNIIARNAMGEMAMAIGSTTSWNHHHLFPDEDYEHIDEYNDIDLIDSVTRWGQRNICSSVASVHARMPRKEDHNDGYSDEESYDMLDEHSLGLKQEEDLDNDEYSIYSDDDRKLPAKVHQPPSNIAIKQESDSESAGQMDTECLTKDETALYSTPVTQQELPDGESNQVLKEEDMEREVGQSNDKSKSTRKVRRRIIYDEVSYFDTIGDNEDDPDEDSSNQGSSSRMPRGFNGPRTRDHYHVRTRSSKKRTRSEHKSKSYRRRKARARKGLESQKKKQRRNGKQLQRKYEMKWSSLIQNSDRDKQLIADRTIISGAEIGAIMQSGTKSEFDVERLMRA